MLNRLIHDLRIREPQKVFYLWRKALCTELEGVEGVGPDGDTPIITY